MWLHLLAGKAAAPPSHLLQYGAASLLEYLVELQQEPPVEPELEHCQTDPVCHLNEASSLYLVLADKFWHAHVLTCPSFFFAKGGAYIKTKEHSTTPNFYRKASSKIENDTRHYNYQRLLVLSNSGRRRLPEPRELHLPCRWEPPRIG